MSGESTVFRGIRCPPSEEQGVVALFAVLLPELGFEIEHIGISFPDCIAWRTGGEGRQRVAIEFEFRSSGFDHDPRGCDVVVCWEADVALTGAEVEVIELRTEVEALTGREFFGSPPAPTTDQLMDRRNVPPEVRKLFFAVDTQLRRLGNVYSKTTGWYVHYRAGKHLFAYVSFYPDCVRVDLFTGGQPLEGAGHSKSPTFKPFFIRAATDLPLVSRAIAESYTRVGKAICEDRPVRYYDQG
jgi:hypothetical protein